MKVARQITDFDEVLGRLRSESKSPADLGTRFEHLMADVLRTDRLYKGRFDRVQMWHEWATENDLVEKTSGRKDLGVDIVARERASGKLCAIQCKCYDDDTYLDVASVSNFISYGMGNGMENFILICTGQVNRNALAHLQGNRSQIITKEHLRSLGIDWSKFPKVVPKSQKHLRDYQKVALDDVVTGFKSNSRGKLIMACGTGKTLVSLHIAEEEVGLGGTVLYLVPSISLILQSMREWSDNANIPHYYMAVCSDKSVRNTEQGTLTELEAPASTDVEELKERLSKRSRDKLNVVFSTYQSIDVVGKAMDGGRFDLVFCDEAHRTTGIKSIGSEGYYTKVHKDKNVNASKRLYMTATPRIYTDHIKGKAAEQEKEVISMNNVDIYGENFHELSFYDAVHKYKALCDFKVRVAVMDGNTMDKLIQKAQAGDESIVPLDEKTLMASVWHAVQYPGADDKKGLLQRVIVFCDMINSSKIFAGEEIVYKKDVKENKEELERAREIDSQRSFVNLISHIKRVTRDSDAHDVEVRHVDGGDNAQDRRSRLEWLKSSNDDPHECRMLSNARCLSEGVDVPALDGIVFLNPRKSIVDVVQAVGRVMRKSPGKEYGYVILPVAIPPGMDIGKALDDSRYFAVVWQVLNALRSHDPKLVDEVNRLILDPTATSTEVTNRIIIRHAYSHGTSTHTMPESKMINGITSKLIQKVGEMNYYDRYGKDLGITASDIERRIINKVEADPNTKYEIMSFHKSLQNVINGSVTVDETVRVLAQHVVLSRVFDAMFQGKFTPNNPIAAEFEKMASKIGLLEELDTLEGFYRDVEYEIEGIKTRDARQNFIKKIYGNFLSSADEKGADRHGVVYTPVEAVDFIIQSTERLLRDHFGVGFRDRTVKILEPFAGTGTFITRLLESGLIPDDRLYDKYKHDIYANELILLAYYVATINIETTYSSLRNGHRYIPFSGMSYTDTLEMNPRYREDDSHRHEATTFEGRFVKAIKGIREQKGSHLHVIIGNPPYSAGQKTFNEDNQNTKYPIIDGRIKDSYVKNSTTSNKRQLYDSYVRSIRWASDRLGVSGIIA